MNALGHYELFDQVSWEDEENSDMQIIYSDGDFSNQVTLTEVRSRIKKLINA